jgi:uncharacterized membrane protein
MKKFLLIVVFMLLVFGASLTTAQDVVELTIATVNNPDMVVMQSFSETFQPPTRIFI